VTAEGAVEDEDSEAELDLAFEFGRLFSARSMQRPVGAEDFAFGVHFRIAPVRAVAKAQIDALKASHPELDTVLELAQEIDLDAVNAMSNDEIQAQFLSIQGLSDAEKAQIQGIDFEQARPVLSTLLEVARDPEDAMTFAILPYFRAQFDIVSVGIMLPLAGFSLGDETRFEVGNLTLDARAAHHFADRGMVGISYGLSMSLPTGMARADALALTDPLQGPYFLHEYIALEPYVAIGVDFRYFLFQADIGVSNLIGVVGSARPDAMSYLRYGIGLVGTPGSIVAVTAELTGGVGLDNAAAFDSHAFTTGLRFSFAGIQPAVAVQFPIQEPGEPSQSVYGGLPFGSPARINVLAQLDMAF
jgi:hypothetical protein